MSEWATKDQARAVWASAPLDDDTLDYLLDVAQAGCEAYAPALDVADPIPVNYTQGVILQAKETLEAMGRVGDVLGFDDGSAVRVRPLSVAVKALLRPRRAVPVIG